MTQQTIGLSGGTSPEATILYYQYLTGEYARRHGDFGWPEILIYSVRFQDLLDWGRAERWDRVASKMVQIFDALQAAGAHFGLMTANTLHIVFDEVARGTSLPLISIVEVTGEAVAGAGCRKVGLLGTATTMRAAFYPDALRRLGIETVLPEEADLENVSRIIYDELTRGIIKSESREACLGVIGRLGERGCDGVILGCTELPTIVSQEDTPLRLFDTTRIHAEAALRRATHEQGQDR